MFGLKFIERLDTHRKSPNNDTTGLTRTISIYWLFMSDDSGAMNLALILCTCKCASFLALHEKKLFASRNFHSKYFHRIVTKKIDAFRLAEWRVR